MSFSSCIKMPISKHENSPEKENTNGLSTSSSIYNELIKIANDEIGRGNWSHAVTSQTVDFVEYVMGKYHVGCAAFVRIQLTDGTFHEDMGYANGESSAKGNAIQTARLYSVTNALIKTLKCFGGVIESKVLKIQNQPQKRNFKNNDAVPITIESHKEGEKYTLTVPTRSISSSDSSRSRSPNIRQSIVVDSEKLRVLEAAKTVVIPVKSEIRNETEVAGTSTNKAPTISKPIGQTNIYELDEATMNELEKQTSVPPGTVSEEELQRLERKRKQKQKQEEFKKLMKEKEMKIEEKPHPRY